MRTKILHKAKLIITVESFKNKPIVNDNPHITIRTISVYDNRTNKLWNEEKIKKRGIENFLNVEDLKETLNWNLNGNSEKYQFKWGQSCKTKSEGKAYVFE